MDLRVEALVAAGRLGDFRIVPQIQGLLSHKEKALREAAAWALGKTGDAKAGPSLIAALADSQGSVQALACLGLGRLGDKKSLAAAAGHLKRSGVSADARAACAYALGMVPTPAFVDDLIAVVVEGNEDVQRKAAWALGRIGDRRALPALVRAYWKKRDSVREAVVWAIVRVWKGGADTTPLTDDDVGVDKGKIDVRALLRSFAADLPPLVIDAAALVGRDQDLLDGLTAALGRHRDIVVRVLRDLDGHPDDLSLGALTLGLSSADPKTRSAVNALLDQLGPALMPALEPLSRHKDAEVRRLVLSVMAKTRSPKAVALIEAALADTDARVRSAAMMAAATWVRLAPAAGSDGGPRLGAALGRRLSAPAWEERRAAVYALASLGPAADVGALVSALADNSGFVREAAAGALGRVGKGGGTVVAALVAAAGDEVPEVRIAVASTLGVVGGAEAQKTLTDLARRDPDERVREAATQALAASRPSGR